MLDKLLKLIPLFFSSPKRLFLCLFLRVFIVSLVFFFQFLFSPYTEIYVFIVFFLFRYYFRFAGRFTKYEGKFLRSEFQQMSSTHECTAVGSEIKLKRSRKSMMMQNMLIIKMSLLLRSFRWGVQVICSYNRFLVCCQEVVSYYHCY